MCSYDMRQEHRWQGTQHVNVKMLEQELEQELEEVKSLLPLLVTSSQREAATRLATEIQENGFSEHSAEEMRKILEGPRTTQLDPNDAAAAVGSSSSSSMGADRKSEVTATAAAPESMTAYYIGYEQNGSPGFAQSLPTTTKAQWSTHHPLLTRGDSGVWMPDGIFSPLYVQASPYGEESAALAMLPQGKSVVHHLAPFHQEGGERFTDLRCSKQNILGSSASPMPIAAHSMNHPAMNVQPNLTHGAPISPMTYTCATFREGKRQARADGDSDQEVFGQPENDIHALLSGEANFENDQPLSMWAPRFANVFFSGTGLPERLATSEMLKEIMVWQICPRRQNLEKLPEWARPTQYQQVIPHDPTIDVLPWPAVQDFFLHNPKHYVAGIFVNRVSLNWPHEESHTVCCEPNSGRLALSPAFREHISNLNNWTVAPELFEQIPFLIGKVRVTGMH
ncbi:hypothetical protein B0J12DRAFT_773955 [Macrophomina phaseolina]|uniref:Uncharacterized protein n=1 Tax=Macrophomina phaseolina TaxID=35725 RepID=A0ABQ8FS59_9PEZI|nr:hypothetical protein B0J12DRAFT_773955 [Macrophomina phaseolina]